MGSGFFNVRPEGTAPNPALYFATEQVPELVANPDRKTLSPMDIVAVLTRVVQEQQGTIDALLDRVAELEKPGR